MTTLVPHAEWSAQDEPALTADIAKNMAALKDAIAQDEVALMAARAEEAMLQAQLEAAHRSVEEGKARVACAMGAARAAQTSP
jgi:hypothetical protein